MTKNCEAVNRSRRLLTSSSQLKTLSLSTKINFIEMSQWKNHYALWTAGLPIISLYIIGSLLFLSKSSFIFLFAAGRQNQYCIKNFFYKNYNFQQNLYKLLSKLGATNIFGGLFCKMTLFRQYKCALNNNNMHERL